MKLSTRIITTPFLILLTLCGGLIIGLFELIYRPIQFTIDCLKDLWSKEQ